MIIRWFRTYPVVGATLVMGVVGLVLFVSGHRDAAQIAVSAYALAIAGWQSIDMVRTIMRGAMGIDILAVTAIVATVIVGEYWASLIIVLMLSGGEALEDYAAGRARTELTTLLDRAPRTAHRLDGQTITEIPINEVRVGDILLVRTNEVVPVDSVLISDEASFDESSLTGESLPVEKYAGDELLSGSVCGDEAVEVKAVATADESQYQRIVAMVEDASRSKAPIVRLADQYAVPFTLASYALAGFAWWYSGDPVRFAEVLVVATPCPLLIGAPVAFIAGMSQAARSGAIVKSGGVLEQMSRVRSALFDKTGTLTYGEPEVVDVDAAIMDPDRVLSLAAAAEQHSTHTLAQSIVSEARTRRLPVPVARDVHETTAHGVTGTVEGHVVTVGKAAFVEEAAGPFEPLSLGVGQIAVYVAIDGQYAGAIRLADAVRTEAPATLDAMRRLGVTRLGMVTGDGWATANHVAAELSLSDVQAECLPQDKVSAVQAVTDRPVMMVGDGVNDAPVIAAADVGVAMGARGSTAASESADVVIMLDDLSRVPRAVAISKRTMTIARQSIWIGIAFSVGLMIVASFGYLPAIFGAALQEVVDLVTVVNALRARGAAKIPGADPGLARDEPVPIG